MSDPRIADALSHLPDYLGQHVIVSAAALALGLLISLPLALLAIRRPGSRWLLLGSASVIQTIPGLALLALFYPLLLGLASLTSQWLGFDFSAFGFLPAVLALSLYSVLPILRNTVTGVLGVDPALKQAALGAGMTPWQSLSKVELPLAMPVIMAGIRTSAVWVIGTATLSTPVGQTSLGNYIFSGLQTQNWIFVLFGCVAAAVLALVVDQLLLLMESGVAMRRRAGVVAGAAGLALVVTAALLPGFGRPGADYVIGAKPFTEQIVLAALMQQRIDAGGHSAIRRGDLGSSIIFNALAANDIDAYVDYSGTIWTNVMKRTDTKARDDMLSEIKRWLDEQHGITMLGALGFENAYALAMPRQRAEKLGNKSIADLARVAPTLSIAGDYEFFSRPEWKSIQTAYGLHFRQERTMQSTFMYAAVASGQVDVISAYTSDGRIARYDLTILADPKAAVPPYDAIVLIAPKRKNDNVLATALQPLIGAINVTLMQQTNLRTDRPDNPQTADNAARWLSDQIKGGGAAR